MRRVIVILLRKFGIAFTSLMFNKNPEFQMAVALLIMFAAYALQVGGREPRVACHLGYVRARNAVEFWGKRGVAHNVLVRLHVLPLSAFPWRLCCRA